MTYLKLVIEEKRLTGDVSGLTGYVSELTGDVTGLRGDVTDFPRADYDTEDTCLRDIAVQLAYAHGEIGQ